MRLLQIATPPLYMKGTKISLEQCFNLGASCKRHQDEKASPQE